MRYVDLIKTFYLQKNDFYLKVFGCSMEPELFEGDVVYIKKKKIIILET